jgi:UDP-glucose 4-epimerase
LRLNRVLVTGGAGYIGSHACVELLQAGYSVVVVDNLSNSNAESLKRVQEITGKALTFYQADVRDKQALADIFRMAPVSTVIHFAGLKAIGESCEQPLNYYHNNIYGMLVLTEVMNEANVKQLIFSSSATVYGESVQAHYSENFPLSAITPYGRSKVMVEDILRDLSAADNITQAKIPWKIAILRYFNPIGAHKSGRIGEDIHRIPSNLIPNISQVAIGKLEKLSVFGNDYPTRDGTGIRDYVHVVDLAKGHIKAIEALAEGMFKSGGCRAFNLGNGRGYSVLEIIQAFEKITGKKIKYTIAGRRHGDLAECLANPELALKALGWKTEENLADMVTDTWRWQINNPEGYN